VSWKSKHSQHSLSFDPSYVLPLVAFGYIGVEIIAMTAFEARKVRSLRWPSQAISYVIFLLYFLCTIGEALNIDWLNKNLPLIYGSYTGHPAPATDPNSSSLPIIATWQANHPKLAALINGSLMFSVLSNGNTALYIASRTMYGMTRDIPDHGFIGKTLLKLSIVVPSTGVPAAALVVSALSFFWMPFLDLTGGYVAQDVGFGSYFSWRVSHSNDSS
jgi:amino acid transporter